MTIEIESIRIRPSKAPANSPIIALDMSDHLQPVFVPLVLFFKAPARSFHATGPFNGPNLTESLQVALDRFPLVTCVIREISAAKYFVNNGEGVELIRTSSPLKYEDLNQNDVKDFVIKGFNDTCKDDTPLFMVKLTELSCGTIALGMSTSHRLNDCTSTTNFLKEWARISRLGPAVKPLFSPTLHRRPDQFLPVVRPSDAITPQGMFDPTYPAQVSVARPVPTQLCFAFTPASLQSLKRDSRPTDIEAWISTGDAVAALTWRALTRARDSLLVEGRQIALSMPVDCRRRSEDSKAPTYFGNFIIPVTVSLSRTELLDGSLAAVALAIRTAYVEQITPEKCANMLAFFEKVGCRPMVCNPVLGDTKMSNWTSYPLTSEAMDFGNGAPVYAASGVLPCGQILITPQRDGYHVLLTVEDEWVEKLKMDEELLHYATVNL